MAKTPTKKRTTKKSATAATSRISPVALNARQMAAAKKCLERSGQIKLGFKEVTFTRLPKSIAPVLTFID